MKDKKPISDYAIFILIVIGMFLTINEIYISNVLEKRIIYRNDIIFDQYVKSNNYSLDYIFIGGSYTRDGINPDYINNSYNLGYTSQNFFEIYLRLREIIEKDKIKVNNVIIGVDTASFSYSVQTDGRDVKEMPFFGNMASLYEIKEATKRSYFDIIIKKYIPVIGNGEELFYIINPPQLENIT